jgi:hypothetical protein
MRRRSRKIYAFELIPFVLGPVAFVQPLRSALASMTATTLQ